MKAFAPAKFLDRKSASGIIGSARGDSTTTNAASAATPRAREAETSGLTEAGPRRLEEPEDEATQADRGEQRARQVQPLGLDPGSRARSRSAIASTATASGTLMKKTHRQDRFSARYPPRTGPSTMVRPVKPAQVPIALPRRSSSKEAPMIASEFGTSSAPADCPAPPWPDHCSGPVASPDHTEARANSTIPAAKTRRRPRWSPRVPPTRTSDAKRSV